MHGGTAGMKGFDSVGPDARPVEVQDRRQLIGQYIRQRKTQEIYRITDVGDAGVTCYRAEGFGGAWGGEEHMLTWRLFTAMYRIMVHVADIDVKGDQ